MLSSKAGFFPWFIHKAGVGRRVCLPGAMPCASYSPKASLLCARAFLHIQLVQKRAYGIRDGDGQNYFKESFFYVSAVLLLNTKTLNTEKEKYAS